LHEKEKRTFGSLRPSFGQGKVKERGGVFEISYVNNG
jgi:hypothetical protein